MSHHDPRDSTTGDAPRASSGGGRRTAAERREDIIGVALGHFARVGYRGVSTQRIASEAGISQPYLFRLFASKQELFLAGCDRACDEIADVLRNAAAGVPERERLARMGRAYAAQVRAGRPAMLMPLQAFAASWEPDIGAHLRRRLTDIVEEIARTSAAQPGELRAFFAAGALLSMIAAIEPSADADDARLNRPRTPDAPAASTGRSGSGAC